MFNFFSKGLFKYFFIFIMALLILNAGTSEITAEEAGTKNNDKNSSDKIKDSFIRNISKDDKKQEGPSPVATQFLPHSEFGYIDWDKALKNNDIAPRSVLFPQVQENEDKIVDMDILFSIDTALNDVFFSHSSHTAWLDCSACHPSIFRIRKGANPVSMKNIRQGEYCGRCHGSVALPLYDCDKCHSYNK